jgi:hypothetical protein
MSDAWEMQFFGSVSTNRTQFTDTDGDGMTDLAEFLAGTNPTNAASKLNFILPLAQADNVFQLRWSTVPGHIYQVQSTTNPPVWTPLSAWLQAKGSNSAFLVTNSPPGTNRMFRIEVRP